MTYQMSAGGVFFGGRGFSSMSAMGGLGGQRTYVASVGHPIANGCGVRSFSSQSLSNLGGSRGISYGGYSGFGSGPFGGHGAYTCGHMGYGTLGFGGRMGHLGNGGLGGYTNFRGDGIRGVTVNENLLKPLHVGVDPQEQEARNHEREEMKTLNDQFACFIDKVRYLEQQNKVLETKWRLLQECAVPAKKSLEPYYENFISNFKKQLDCLLNERDQLTREEASIQHLVEEFKSRYEEEAKRRTTAENEFVLLKKDVDSIFLSKEELEGKVDMLSRELEFRACVHGEELAQLDSQVYDANILLQMDNSRNLDVDQIIKNVEAWYQSIAQRSKEEANVVYENKFLELQEQRGKHSDHLKINQHQIVELNRLLNKMQSEHDMVKKQVDCLQSTICDVEQRGDAALKDARDKDSELQTAVQKAKDDLARLLKDYNELLNTKLALDIEIATYKTMLEGEESRISTGNFVSIDVVKPPYIQDSIGYPAPCGYGAMGLAYGVGCGMGYGADYGQGMGSCRRRRSYSIGGGGYGRDYSGGYTGGRGGGNDGQCGRRGSWSAGYGGEYGGTCGGGYSRGYGGASGGGYSGGYGGASGGGYSGGYGGASGGGYSGGYGGASGGGFSGGYGGASGGGFSGGHSGASGGGYGRGSRNEHGGEYSGGCRDWSSRSGEGRPRTAESSTGGGRGSGDAEHSGRGYSSGNVSGSASRQGRGEGHGSGSAQGSANTCKPHISGGLGGGWTSGGYLCQPVACIPTGGGGFTAGGPVVVRGSPGVVRGVDVGCVSAVGIPAAEMQPIGVSAVGMGGIGVRQGPW